MYAIIAIKHYFPVHNRLLGPSRDIENRGLRPRFSTSTSLQKLMHEMVIFILSLTQDNFKHKLIRVSPSHHAL